MIGSITSGGALDDEDVNDWAPSRLGAALDDDVNDWARHVWGAALDDDDVNDWARHDVVWGIRLMMM